MSLDTIIHASLSRPARPVTALVLMGGGARTAYQVGVLRALASILKSKPQTARFFPFQVLVGTSAGAINAACLAGYATNGLQAFERLAQFWGDLRSSGVYQLNVSPWARFNKFIAAWSLSRHARANGAILDNLPLRDTLQRAVSLPGVEEALRSHTIEALAVTASSYTSGVHWTFCHTAPDNPFRAWARPGRRAGFQRIGIEHLMASSAIPFLFPSTRLAVDRHQEYFGDGSMRQISPLSPALHLGAQKVFAVGVGQPERAGFARHAADAPVREPALGNIAGHAMASVFHDTLRADVEQTHRVTQTLRQLPREAASVLPFRRVDVLAIQPTQSLDALAQEHVRELPAPTRNALGGLGILKGGGGTLASYLLFEPGFVQALIAMGENDAYARKAEVLAFFSGA
ncbi:patatin-like phospholipase family protein [Rhodoferax sp.]|uniref:patatin-like phospholipase family protein n=1 Tax=Rhodoferax sp. TaxID=50421 RepID=UPI00271C6D64|nr:patatin-like phospholipase family protein [Rhodoferax sp.]MDO9196868.1 patatin-like phospholipase family protein [Rhodoferax sp.]